MPPQHSGENGCTHQIKLLEGRCHACLRKLLAEKDVALEQARTYADDLKRQRDDGIRHRTEQQAKLEAYDGMELLVDHLREREEKAEKRAAELQARVAELEECSKSLIEAANGLALVVPNLVRGIGVRNLDETLSRVDDATWKLNKVLKPTDPRSVSDTVQLAKEIDADIEKLDDAPWKRGFRKCVFCPDSFPVVRNSLGWGRNSCNACSRRKSADLAEFKKTEPEAR